MSTETPQRFRVVRVGNAFVAEFDLPEEIEAIEFDAINTALGLEIVNAAAGRWVLDLTGAAYFGSALLGLLINVRSKVRKGRGTLVLCGMNPRLARVLRAGSMEKLFDIVDDRTAALGG
ncbi:MAG TPA: STAS domain-containing protein [Tepidisphaeraceae bacterium]|jgi:anti-anti-sigma factor